MAARIYRRLVAGIRRQQSVAACCAAATLPPDHRRQAPPRRRVAATITLVIVPAEVTAKGGVFPPVRHSHTSFPPGGNEVSPWRQVSTLQCRLGGQAQLVRTGRKRPGAWPPVDTCRSNDVVGLIDTKCRHSARWRH